MRSIIRPHNFDGLTIAVKIKEKIHKFKLELVYLGFLNFQKRKE